MYSSCPFLVKHLTCYIPAVGGVLFVFVLATLLQTTFSDPGILPRATTDEAIDIEKQIGTHILRFFFAETRHEILPRCFEMALKPCLRET